MAWIAGSPCRAGGTTGGWSAVQVLLRRLAGSALRRERRVTTNPLLRRAARLNSATVEGPLGLAVTA